MNTEPLNMSMEFLFEHNVVNIEAVARFVEPYARECANPTAQEWFRTIAARYLAKSEEYNVTMPPNRRLIGAAKPDWLDAAVARGDDLRMFQPPEEMRPLFEHLVDYFNWLAATPQGERLFTDKQRFMRLTVGSAIQKSREWVVQQSKEAERADVPMAPVVYEDGSYYWIKPTDRAVLIRDGRIIQNCLGQGTYADEVARGRQQVYIMRDQKGTPHVAIRVDKGSVAEVKGKQNQPPVGRYVELTKRFLNHLALPITAIGDIERMGLRLTKGSDGKTKLSGLRDEDVGTVVWASGPIEVVNEGEQYWFLDKGQISGLLTITVNGVRVSNVSQEASEAKNIRPYIQGFLNQFPEGAPPPGKEPGDDYGRKDALRDNLDLRYNGANKKYGTLEEVGVEVMKEGDLVVLMWKYMSTGTTSYVSSTSYYVMRNDKRLLHIDVAGNSSKLSRVYFEGETEDELPDDYVEMTCGIMNHLGIKDPDERFRETTNERAIWTTKGFGWISDVAEKAWSKGKLTAYLWHTPESGEGHNVQKASTYLTFLKGDKLEFEISNKTGTGTFRVSKPPNTFVSSWPGILIEALNKSKDLTFLKKEKTDFFDWGVFISNKGKWGTREDIAAPYHKFESGMYFGRFSYTEDPDKAEYVLFMPDGRPVYSAVVSERPDRDVNWLREGINLGKVRHLGVLAPYMKWLFNTLKLDAMDVPADGRSGYSSYRRNSVTDSHVAAFQMGLFYDSRKDEWRSIEEGSKIYEASNWTAYKFRNRILIWDDKLGMMGWIKLNGFRIGNITPIEPYDRTDLLPYLSELTQDVPEIHWGAMDDDDLRRAGFHQRGDDGERYRHVAKSIHRINDTFGSDEDFLPLKSGWKWKHLPYDPEFSDDEHRNDSKTGMKRLHKDRYTLVDGKDQWWMRASFSKDGFLEDITWREIVQRPRYRDGPMETEVDTHSSTKDMNQKFVPLLVSLLEKTDFRLTPQQAADLKVYPKNGRWLSMGKDKSLTAFANGFIDFKDGHVFQRDKYDSNKWQLCVPNPNPEDRYHQYIGYMTVELSNEGVESISFTDPKVKRQPKLYTPYLHKLIDIFAKTAGESEEE